MNGVTGKALILMVVGWFVVGQIWAAEYQCSTLKNTRTAILAVGSETVYPFSAYVCEYFGAATEYPTPMVVKITTSEGIKLFVENDNVDIANASRRITKDEYEIAKRNGVGPILEFGFGHDGIVFAKKKAKEKFNLSLDDVFLALAKVVPENGRLIPNPYKKWGEINSDLPDKVITIYGPGAGSGTLATIKQLIMDEVSIKYPEYGGSYSEIRSDGIYDIYNDNEAKIIHELMNNKNAVGIIDYSFLVKGHEYLSAVSIEGVAPEKKDITTGTYPLSRKLYVYLKVTHLDMIPGLKELFNLFISESILGDKGVFDDMGMITLSSEEYMELLDKWSDMTVLKPSDLELIPNK